MSENLHGRVETIGRNRIERAYHVSDETENLPYYDAAHHAIQIACDGFTPGLQKAVALDRKGMEQIKAAGGTPDQTLHGMIHQLKLNIAVDMLENVALRHHVTEKDEFVVEGSVICMAEADFGDFLESLSKHVALAIGAAVEADRVTRAAANGEGK